MSDTKSRIIGYIKGSMVYSHAAIRDLHDWYNEAQIKELLAGKEVLVGEEDGEEVYEFIDED